jgi:hypothetical protein
MDIGRAKVVVVVMMPVGMTVAAIVVTAKQPGTDEIDPEAKCCDQDGLAIRNRTG